MPTSSSRQWPLRGRRRARWISPPAPPCCTLSGWPTPMARSPPSCGAAGTIRARTTTAIASTTELPPAREPPATMNQSRPKYLNLFEIRLPVPALVSILHRISGLVLFLFLPYLLWLLQASLASPESFERYRAVLANPLAKLTLIALL